MAKRRELEWFYDANILFAFELKSGLVKIGKVSLSGNSETILTDIVVLNASVDTEKKTRREQYLEQYCKIYNKEKYYTSVCDIENLMSVTVERMVLSRKEDDDYPDFLKNK